jgi:glycogen synthase
MISNEKMRSDLAEFINHDIIRKTNFIPNYFITVKYTSNRSWTAKDKIDKFIPVSDTRSLHHAERNAKHFINLLYCKIYNKSNVNRINDNKFRMLVFHENNESEDYHTHIISENIPNIIHVQDLDTVLSHIQIKHKGIQSGSNGIHSKLFCENHVSYCCKTVTEDYYPLDIYNSSLI